MLLLIFAIAGALIGDGLAGSLGAGIGLLVGFLVFMAIDIWAEGY